MPVSVLIAMNFSRFSSSRINLADLFITREKIQDSEEDDEDTATVRRLNQENRCLLVQLDAAREALFNHQRKTQEKVEKHEEDLQELRRKLFDSAQREDNSLETIGALQMALQEMQSEKQQIQRKSSDSMEELLKRERKNQSELRGVIERLTAEVTQKEDESIRLCMTILKVQEDLTKENHIKERAIEQRDRNIEAMEKALSDLRLESEARKMAEALARGNVSGAPGDQPEESWVSLLQKKTEEQEVELSSLRKENQDLRRRLETRSPEVTATAKKGDLTGSETDCTKGDIGGCTKDQLKSKVEETKALRKKLLDSEELCRRTQERADRMTLLLNQKLIELNKLQLTLSNQTKEMIQLEKAYYQLRCHLSRGFAPLSSSRSKSSSRVDLST